MESQPARPHPARATSRSCARWKDYDAIVIGRHSQGSAITADLPRFLGDEGIAAPPNIWLFTMGCLVARALQ